MKQAHRHRLMVSKGGLSWEGGLGLEIRELEIRDKLLHV